VAPLRGNSIAGSKTHTSSENHHLLKTLDIVICLMPRSNTWQWKSADCMPLTTPSRDPSSAQDCNGAVAHGVPYARAGGSELGLLVLIQPHFPQDTPAP
jgi:hypothetical protein